VVDPTSVLAEFKEVSLRNFLKCVSHSLSDSLTADKVASLVCSSNFESKI